MYAWLGRAPEYAFLNSGLDSRPTGCDGLASLLSGIASSGLVRRPVGKDGGTPGLLGAPARVARRSIGAATLLNRLPFVVGVMPLRLCGDK